MPVKTRPQRAPKTAKRKATEPPPKRPAAKGGKPAKRPAAKAAEVPAGEFAILPLDRITPSPHNARKTFDPDELARLTDSVKEKGVLEPVIVRPRKNLRVVPGRQSGRPGYFVVVCASPTGPETEMLDFFKTEGEAEASLPRYELVAGERRFRASAAAGRDTIPAMIRDLDDRAAAEVGVIENDQRADVPPLEQAEGYAHLISLGDDVATIAAKIGRPNQYVSNRLQLANLVDELKDDMRRGWLGFGHAYLLARLCPDDQREARVQFLYDCDPGTEGDLAAEPPVLAPISELKRSIKFRCVQDLADAPWELDDAGLVPEAGSCTRCPKRQGANPTLFDELVDAEGGKKADRCLDRVCYQRKKEALIQLAIRTATEKAGEEPVKITSNYYVRQPDVLTADRYEVVTAKEAKAAKPGAVRPAVYVDEHAGGMTGKTVFVRVKKEKTAGNAGKAGGATPAGDDTYRKEERERKKKAMVGRAASFLANRAVADKAENVYRLIEQSPGLMPLLLRPLVAVLSEVVWSDACRLVAKRRELPGAKDPRPAVAAFINQLDDPAVLFGLLCELVASRKSQEWGSLWNNGTMTAEERALWAAFDVDRATLTKQAAAEKKGGGNGQDEGEADDDQGKGDTAAE